MKKLGLGMTIFFAMFMLAASVAPKLLGSELAIQPLVQIGWPSEYMYLIGALVSHLRAGSPMFSHTLFSLYLGAFMWLALWLRDERVRKIFPYLQDR